MPVKITMRCLHPYRGRILRPFLVIYLCALATTVWSASGPATITQQPTNQTVLEGEQPILSVGADGTTPLEYQWFRRAVAIAGATQPTLVLQTATLNDDRAVFSVAVSNALGSATSSNATLTVSPGIVVTASANDSTEVEVPGGWPLILEVALLHPLMFDSNAVPILICSTNGPWSNSLEIRAFNAEEQIQNWPLRPIPMTDEALVLTDTVGGRLLWRLSPEETAQLMPGQYELRVTLQTTNITKPSAWKGVVESVPVMITITNEPSVLTEDYAEEKHRLFARYALLQGNEQQARQHLDALLAAYPTNIGGLTLRTYLQKRSGLLVEALQTTERALDQVFAQFPLAEEPPGELLHNLAELQSLLAPPTLAFTLAAGQLTLQWDGRPDTQYKLESSGNLTAWEVRSTNFTVINNSYSWTTNVTSSRQFFRVTF